jgi:FkbM family methyltransferase
MIERPDEVVAAAYNLLLDRDPEPAGLRHWSSALASGLPRTQFVRAMLSSAEFRQRMATPEELTKYGDVDLIIPIGGAQLRTPASDTSLVPHLLAHRSWEPHILHWLTQTLQPSHVFVDVGANIGYFTVLCAPLVARVVAFEPAAASYDYCRSNVSMNGLTNVDLHRYGLWHEDATLQMGSDASSLMTATLATATNGRVVEAIDVVALDSLIRRALHLPRLDVIKMDIEGAEVSALRGMRETLARFRPLMVMEVNRPALTACDATVDDVWDYFTDMGYGIRAFEAWKPCEPVPVRTLDELKAHCPEDSLIDILAVPEAQ